MDYLIKRSARRTLSLEITGDCEVLIRAPYNASEKTINDFADKNRCWIGKKLDLQRKRMDQSNVIDAMQKELTDAAKRVIPQLVKYYSEIMKLYPTSVKITSAKTRFGSCSGKNAICFSWRLMAYPKEAVDYVVVHELAHIKQHNHSAAFYRTVEKYMPDYKKRAQLLKSSKCIDLTKSYL